MCRDTRWRRDSEILKHLPNSGRLEAVLLISPGRHVGCRKYFIRLPVKKLYVETDP